MSVTSVPFAVLRFQYQVVRLPLQLIEERLFARLDSEAPARLFFERSLGKLDETVGSALGDQRLQRRGAALAERSDALARAARLESAASQKRAHAEADLEAKQDKVTEDVGQVRQSKESAVQDAKTAAAERKRAAERDAQKRTAEAKKRVDDAAARRTDSVESAKRQQQEKIEAAERRASAAAKAKLDDANEKRSAAATKRAQADRIEELADVEKAKRQAERAHNNA
jgi:hypothetical protein